MASDVIVKFGADLTELSKAFKDAEDETKGLGNSISGTLTSIGGGLKSAGTALSGAVTVPIIAIAGFAMKSASDVNGAMRSIERQTGLTGVALDSVKTQFKNVASNVPEDIGKVGEVFTTLVSKLGLVGPQLESISKQMIDMARIMGVDAASAAESLATVFKAFNVPASEMGNRMDELTYISQNTGVSFDDLTDTMAKAAPIARAAGIDFDDTAVMIANFSAAGLPARQSISMLTSVITKLGAGGKDAGKEWTAMVERFKVGKETAADIELLGANVIKFRDAVKTGKIGNDEFKEGLAGSHGLIEKTADATRTFGERLQILRNRLEIAFAPVGSAIFAALGQLLDMLQPVINVVTRIAEAFGNLPAPVKMFIVILGGIAAAIGPVLIIIGTIVGALAPLVPIVMAIVGFLTGGAILTTLVGIGAAIIPLLPIIAAILGIVILIAAPIIAVGAALLAAYHYSETFRNTLNTIIGVVKELGTHIGAALGKFMSGDFKGGLNELKTGFTEAFNTLKKMNWAEIGKNIIHETVVGIRGAMGMLTDAWNAIKTSLMAWIATVDWNAVGKQLADLLVKGIKAVLNIPKMLTDMMKGGIPGAAAKPGEKTTEGTTGGPSNAAFAGAVGTAATAFITALKTGLMTYLHGQFMTDFTAAVTLMIPIIIEMVRRVIDLVGPYILPLTIKIGLWLLTEIGKIPAFFFMLLIGALGLLGNFIWGLISPIPGRLWSGFVSALGSFGSWLAGQLVGIGQAIWGFIVGAVGQFGSWLDGLVGGIGSTIWGLITGAVGAFGSWLGGLVGGIGGSIWSSITGAVGQFGSWLTGLVGDIGGKIWSSITAAVGTFGTWLANLVTGIGAKILSDIQASAGAIGDAVKNAILGAIGGVGSAAAKTLGLQHGGIVAARPGGVLATIAEGGAPEAVIPQKYWGGIDPNILNALPKYGSGAIVGTTNLPAGNVRQVSTAQPNVEYNAFVTVDSENITRKVFVAFQEMENYHHL